MEAFVGKTKQERIEELKSFKRLANKILAENKKLQKEKHPSWMSQTVQENIKSLQQIIKSLNHDLSEKKLDEYSSAPDDFFGSLAIRVRQSNALSFFGEVSKYTVPGSVTYDINWLTDFTLADKIDIALGIKPPDFLASYLPATLIHVKNKLLPELSQHFPEQASVLDTAITLCEEKDTVSANILLMTLIEGIVRRFCVWLAQAQGLVSTKEEAEQLVGSKQSLEGVITRIDWNREVEMKTIDLLAYYDYVTEPEVTEAKEVVERSVTARKKLVAGTGQLADTLEAAIKKELPDETAKATSLKIIANIQRFVDDMINFSAHKTKISLKVHLHFLIRRFKEDRNTLIHGSFEGFDAQWKTYTYLCALIKVYGVFKTYDRQLLYSLLR